MALRAQRIFAASLASLALLGGTLAAPAAARQHHVFRAHIAVGCHPAISRHHRHSGTRCQSLARGHVFFAHAA